MYPEHLISDKIAAFYDSENNNYQNDDAERFFNDNQTLNFKEIHAIIVDSLKPNCDSFTEKDFQSTGYEGFLQVYQKLRPIFCHSQVVVASVKIEQLHLKWLGDIEVIVKAFKSPPPDLHGTENVERILLLTAMLEFALGSIFYTISGLKTLPPHLLKDLLATKELETFFGLETLMFLRILIGTPKAINLRNIVWHGFPKPKNIPTFYVSTLVIIIHSLGSILAAKKFKFKFRKQIDELSLSLETIRCACDIPTNFSIDKKTYDSIIDHCSLIPQDYRPYWLQLYSCLQTAEYCRFVILILPQIELVLRLLYAKFNDFDVSAKLDEYYITLDTIFEPTVPNTANQNQLNCLLTGNCHIPIGAFNFLYDIFLSPKGPRLRDKISHGEISMKAINNQQLCNILLYLSLSLLTRDEHNYPIAKYESQFHENSLAKIAINKARKTCSEFMQEFKIENETNLDLIVNYVSIFQRPKKEVIYMLLITKIANLLYDTCHNFKESISLRKSLLLHHELHSKRRRTLENIIKSLPKFCSSLNLILKCLFEIYKKLQGSNEDFEMHEAVNLQRFLKHTLKIAENLVKYSHKDNNEWIKITELCQKFDEIYKRLYL